MDNKDIEVLDDFGDEINNQTIISNNNTPMEEIKLEEVSNNKKQEENPVVEMINNKGTIRLIGFLLIVLFLAVFLMPQFFKLIGKI